MNKRRLGRGLDSLLGTDEGGSEASSLESADMQRISIDRIDSNPFQPRKVFDHAEIASLADSVRQHGVLQPIIVRVVEDRYQLIAGERRLRACQVAKLTEIPARIMILDDRRVSELAMVENLQREDLNAIEKAMAFRDYLAQYGGTQEDLANRLGLDRSTISNLIRLLELPGEVHEAVVTKRISQGHARALLGLGDKQSILTGLHRVVDESLNVRQTEAMVTTGVPSDAKTRIRKDPAEKIGETRAPHFVEFETHLQNHLGTPVAIKQRSKGRGQIVIEYQSDADFARVSELIRGH